MEVVTIIFSILSLLPSHWNEQTAVNMEFHIETHSTVSSAIASHNLLAIAIFIGHMEASDISSNKACKNAGIYRHLMQITGTKQTLWHQDANCNFSYLHLDIMTEVHGRYHSKHFIIPQPAWSHLKTNTVREMIQVGGRRTMRCKEPTSSKFESWKVRILYSSYTIR